MDLNSEDLELIKAEQQLTGFMYAKEGLTLKELVSGMGLTAGEWHAMKRRKMIDWMPEDMRQEINLYFHELKD